MKTYKRTKEFRDKISESKKGKKNPNWKGDKAGYNAIHNWVTRRMGQPRYCKVCERTDQKRYEWANISGEYKRELSDYERLCNSCHQKKDQKTYAEKREKQKPLKRSQIPDFLAALGFVIED